MIYQSNNKILSKKAICSEKKAEILIQGNTVTVNSQLTEIRIKTNQELDNIKFKCKKKNFQNFSSKLFLINKPKCSMTNFYYNYKIKHICDLHAQKYKKVFYSIERLDDIRRVLIQLRSYGNLCYKYSHSIFGNKKNYLVKIDVKADINIIKESKSEINLQEEKTHSFRINKIKNDSKCSILKIILKEESNRLIIGVKNSLSYIVNYLKNTVFRSFSLDILKECVWSLKKY